MNNNKTNLTKSTMNYYNLPHDIFNLIQSFVVDDKVEHKKRLNAVHNEIKKPKNDKKNMLMTLTHVFLADEQEDDDRIDRGYYEDDKTKVHSRMWNIFIICRKDKEDYRFYLNNGLLEQYFDIYLNKKEDYY